MIYYFLYSLILSYFIGYLIFKNFKLSCYGSIINVLHKISLGLGFTSILFWQFTLISNGNNKYYYLFEITIFFILAILAYKKNTTKKNKLNIKFANPKLAYLAYFLLILQIILISLSCFQIPLGMWDAQAIWNLKAKFLAFGNENWSKIFENRFDYIHRDYPMLLPATIARAFYYTNDSNYIISIFYAIFFTSSCLLLLYKYLEKQTNAYIGITSIIIITSNMYFIIYGSWQYADIPIALYFFISIYYLSKYIKSLKTNDLKACILFSSLTPWIKNEGKTFILTYIAILLYITYKNKKQIMQYFVFYIPNFIFLYQLKMLSQSNNYLINNITERLHYLINLERHKTILSYITTNIPFFYIAFLSFIVIYTLKSTIKEKKLYLISLPIIFNALAYYCVYLITPFDLNWQLETSCVRVYLQLLPSIIFIFFTIIHSEYKLFEEKTTDTSPQSK